MPPFPGAFFFLCFFKLSFFFTKFGNTNTLSFNAFGFIVCKLV